MDNYSLTHSNPASTYIWDIYFKAIEKCNEVLYFVESNDQTQEYLAEARFLRAYNYFHLTRLYGDVPLVLSECSPVLAPQSSREAVFTQIETDLLLAIPELKLKSELQHGERYKATKGAAKSVLAMVYVWQERWSDAKEVLEQIIDSQQYSLLSDFNNLWLEINDHNNESVFEYEYHSNLGFDWGNFDWEKPESHLAVQMLGPANLSGDPDYNPGWGFGQVTPDLVNFFDSRNEVIRKNATILDIQQRVDNGASHSMGAYSLQGYKNNKYTTRKANTSEEYGAVPELNYGQNFVKIRYAEILLLYAETLARMGQLPEAVNPLNMVRQRAGLPEVNGLSQEELLDVIFDERTTEFACEGKRFFDLIRWGKASEVLSDSGFVAGRDELWPIPYLALKQNPLVSQNSGYQMPANLKRFNTEIVGNPYAPKPSLPWNEAEKNPIEPSAMEIYHYNLCMDDSLLTQKGEFIINESGQLGQYTLKAFDPVAETFHLYYKEIYQYDDESRLASRIHLMERGEEWDTTTVSTFEYLPENKFVDSTIYYALGERLNGDVYYRLWDETTLSYTEERLRYVQSRADEGLIVSEFTTFRDRRYKIQYNGDNQTERLLVEIKNSDDQWDPLWKTENTFSNGNKIRIEKFDFWTPENGYQITDLHINTYDSNNRLISSKHRYGPEQEIISEFKRIYQNTSFSLVEWTFSPNELVVDRLVGARQKTFFNLENSTSVFDPKENSKKSRIVIAPNPSDGNITLVPETVIPGNVQVYDLRGKMVLEQTISGNKLNLTSLANGMYFLNFGKNTEPLKIFIER